MILPNLDAPELWWIGIVMVGREMDIFWPWGDTAVLRRRQYALFH